MKNKRVFVIVIDSLGIGYDDKAKDYGDEGANTLGHIFAENPYFQIPNLEAMGLCNLTSVNGHQHVEQPIAYYGRLKEASVGKDTMTGHWEIMGVYTTEPFVTFTETGFPKELIEELKKQTGYDFIGNKAASGTEIIKELGERQLATKELIIYTSADSVLQIAANVELFGLEEIYRVCKIARDITMKPEWLVGRVIARPFIGNKSTNFERTADRHDYALSPTAETVLDQLKEKGYDVISIGKIVDIFNNQGITEAIRSKSSDEGMLQTIDVAGKDFNGICFTNLVDFDAKFGHRRDWQGYGRELVNFDKHLGTLMATLKEDDLLIVTADHGNDPTWKGSDHTREYVPLLAYSKAFKHQGKLPDGASFADIGLTIADIFGLDKHYPIGTSFKDKLL